MEWQLLIEGFEFDIWANRRWLTYLEARGMPQDYATIFSHILGAQKIWAARVDGESPTALELPPPTSESIEAIHGQWISLLTNRQEDTVIHYRRTTGEEHAQKVSEIARHVIDHGTYHRGQLRGLCQRDGRDDFPETGLMLYFLKLD